MFWTILRATSIPWVVSLPILYATGHGLSMFSLCVVVAGWLIWQIGGIIDDLEARKWQESVEWYDVPETGDQFRLRLRRRKGL